MDDRLRELLQRKADEVPPHRYVPRSLLGRARRRIALNLLGVGAAVVVLAAGAVAGVRTLGGAHAQRPGGGSSAPAGLHTATPGGGTPACSEVGLDGRADLQRAAGSRVGSIRLVNPSTTACLLWGRPDVLVFSVDGGTPTRFDVKVSAGAPWWQVEGRPKPDGWPIVRVNPGGGAILRTAWSNWCLPTASNPKPPDSWQINVNGADVAVFTSPEPPGCLASTKPSTIEIGPFEPAADEPPVGPTPPPSPSTSIAACTPAQLRAVGSMQGAAGSREGAIGLTNLSGAACTLRGRPVITLLDQSLNPIPSGVTLASAPAGWMVDGKPKPSGWPVVTLRPGDSASIRIRWSNWCPQGRPAPLWRITIWRAGTVDVANGLDSVTPPPCNGPGQPTTIEEGPFEPGS